MDKLLELLEQDCSMTTEQLATIAGMSEADVKAAIHKYEEERVILGYKAIIDWDRVRQGGRHRPDRGERGPPVRRRL